MGNTTVQLVHIYRGCRDKEIFSRYNLNVILITNIYDINVLYMQNLSYIYKFLYT